MNKKVEKTEFNISRCQCLNCPSYSTDCKIRNAGQTVSRPTEILKTQRHYEKMFCAFEESNCIHLNKGCVCETCANYHAYNLKNRHWCLRSLNQG